MGRGELQQKIFADRFNRRLFKLLSHWAIVFDHLGMFNLGRFLHVAMMSKTCNEFYKLQRVLHLATTGAIKTLMCACGKRTVTLQVTKVDVTQPTVYLQWRQSLQNVEQSFTSGNRFESKNCVVTQNRNNIPLGSWFATCIEKELGH